MGPEGTTPFPREQSVSGRQTFTGHWSTSARNHLQPNNKTKLTFLHSPSARCISHGQRQSRRYRGSNFVVPSFRQETEFTAFYFYPYPCGSLNAFAVRKAEGCLKRS